jgi:hypothetical protein
MTRRLSKIRIDEISLVDVAANPGARVLLRKRDNTRSFGKGDDDMDLVPVAKRVIAGEPSAFEKRDFYAAIESGAAEIRKADESPEQAFARFCQDDPRGQVLLKAHKLARGADYTPVPKLVPVVPQSTAYATLCKKASKLAKRENLSEARAFAKVYEDPANRELVEADRAAHHQRVSKAIGTAPAERPATAVQAVPTSPAYGALQVLADKIREAKPELSKEQAFAAALATREGQKLYRLYRSEIMGGL